MKEMQIWELSVPKLHIASMGIEKIIPRLEDLSVFTRSLARSATGQPITSYTSHFHGSVEGGKYACYYR